VDGSIRHRLLLDWVFNKPQPPGCFASTLQMTSVHEAGIENQQQAGSSTIMAD
jgi:hypothetical protein